MFAEDHGLHMEGDVVLGSVSFLPGFRKAFCERVRSAIGNILAIGGDHRNWCNEIDFRSSRKMEFSKHTLSVSQHYVSSSRSFDNRDSCATVDLVAHAYEPFGDTHVGGRRVTERGDWKLIPERHS